MKFVKRSFLRRKLMSLKGSFISVCGSRRRDNSSYYKSVCIINQTRKVAGKNLLTVIEIKDKTLAFKSLALERLKFFVQGKDIYYIYDERG